MKDILNKISKIWKDIEDGKLTSKEVYFLLTKYNEEIQKLSNKEISFELSQMIIRLYQLLELTPDTDKDLKITSIILRTKENPLLYIFDKRAIKVLATNIDWFFKLYTKLEVLAENDNFILLKDKKPSNIAFTANIVLNEKRVILHKKEDSNDWFDEFYNSIKNPKRD